MSPSHLHYLPLLQFIFYLRITKGPVNEEKEGKDVLLACTWNREKFDVARRQGRENSHTTKSVPFCLQQPKMDSFFLLLSASSLRQERMESV